MPVLDSMIIEFNAVERSFKPFPIEELASHLEDTHKILWIHCNLNQSDDFSKLTELLHLPENVIKLCDKEETIPTLIDVGETLTIRVRCLISSEFNGEEPINYGTLILHLTPHYCFTATYHELPSLVAFTESYVKAIRYAKTPCFILFLILDNIINEYSTILYDVELAADEIDLQLRAENMNPYNEVMSIKKQIMKVKRYMMAIRDILMRISGRKIEVVSEQCRASLGNLFDHSQMIVGKSEAIREILNGTLDQIDNALMHKLSQSMKVLTAVSAAFLPPTLIASIYGMNFHWIPELSWKYGYFYSIFLMLLTAVILMVIFKINKWL